MAMLSKRNAQIRSKLLAVSLAALVAGCAPQTQQGEDGDSSWFKRVASSAAANDWTLKRTSSAIDGETLTATREYSFASQNTQFDVEITCQPSKKITLGDVSAGSLGSPLSMKIKSFVGDLAQPADESAFVAETGVVRQNDYSNPVELNYPVARVRIGDNIYSGPMVNMVLRIGDYSNEAIYTGLLALGESIPMSIELKNGAGAFELEIDRSNEVEQVLAACGQDEASLAHKKSEQQREHAKNIAMAELEHACSTTGSASAYNADLVKRKISELAIPPGAVPDMELDCEKNAPEALARFNGLVDDHYRAYLQLRGSGVQTCSREEFMTRLKDLDDGVNIGAADLAFFLSSQSFDCEHDGSAPSRRDIPDQTGAAGAGAFPPGSYDLNSPQQPIQAEADAAAAAAAAAADD